MAYINEEYKAVPGYEGLYEISMTGAVRRASNARCIAKVGRAVQQWRHRNGYMQCILSSAGHRKNHYVHRLVALAFIPNPDSKATVNHIDGDKTNNARCNLEWATYAENMHHAHRLPGNTDPRGEGNCNARLTTRDVLEIRARRGTGETYKSIAMAFGITRMQASQITRGLRWAHV